MKTRAVRLYGEMDLRMEEFELPAIKDTEILACVISDSICVIRASQFSDRFIVILLSDFSFSTIVLWEKFLWKHSITIKGNLQDLVKNYAGKILFFHKIYCKTPIIPL